MRMASIVMNLGAAIAPQPRPPCRIVGNAGITLPERADSYYVADPAVTCDRPANQRCLPPEPRLIVEVLSRSSVAHDRGRKGEEYGHISGEATCSCSATSGGSSCGAGKGSDG